MITKEQKDLIKEVKKESGTNEFLSVSDLMAAITERYPKQGYFEYAVYLWQVTARWNDFLRNTPLSMDLFIGEGAIFEGFNLKPLGRGKILTLKHNELGLVVCEDFTKEVLTGEIYFQWIPNWKNISNRLSNLKSEVLLTPVLTLEELMYKTKQTKPITLK